MKNFLLTGIASLTFFSSLAQSQQTLSSSISHGQGSLEDNTRNFNNSNTRGSKQRAAASYSWNPFTSSMNAFNSLVSNSKQLQYNDELNVVTFVHRKSPDYTLTIPPTPGYESNVMVSMVSSNWGASWDSTCIWRNDTIRALYPQGGVYNPPGNTQLSNAYIVGTGLASTTGWIGNWFASKALGTSNYNNIPSSVLNAQQFISNAPPYGPMNKVDFARYGLNIPDNGVV